MSTEELNRELKDALLHRDFARAQSLIEQWGELVAQSIKAAGSEAQRRPVFEEALALGQRNLSLARVVRAQIASELYANSASLLYADSGLEPPRWQLNA